MTRLHAGPEKVRSPYLRVNFPMSYRNNDRDGSRRREDRNHRPFRGGGGGGGRGGRSGGRGGRPGGNHQVDTGGFRGVRINIDENTPYATDFADLGVPVLNRPRHSAARGMALLAARATSRMGASDAPPHQP